MIIHYSPFSPPLLLSAPFPCPLYLSTGWTLPLPLSPHFMQFDKPVSARHLKLVILQGFEHFVSVYSIGSCGTPVQE